MTGTEPRKSDAETLAAMQEMLRDPQRLSTFEGREAWRQLLSGRTAPEKMALMKSLGVRQLLPDMEIDVEVDDQTDVAIEELIPDREIFRNFVPIYHEEIRPYLKDQELNRAFTRAAAKKMRGRAILALAAGIVGNMLIRAVFGETGLWDGLATLVFLLGLGYAALLYLPIIMARRHVVDDTREHLVRRVMEGLGLAYQRRPDTQPGLDVLKRWDVVPDQQSYAAEDHIAGKWEGVPFEFYELDHLIPTRRHEDLPEAVFRGPVFVIDFPSARFGDTIILGKDMSGLFDDLFQKERWKDLKRLNLPPAFSDQFDVFASDQVEARVLLDPVYMETLIHLQKTLSGSGLRVILEGSRMTIAMSGPDRFELGDPDQSLAHPERLTKFLWELDDIFRMIEIFTKQRTS